MGPKSKYFDCYRPCGAKLVSESGYKLEKDTEMRLAPLVTLSLLSKLDELN